MAHLSKSTWSKFILILFICCGLQHTKAQQPITISVFNESTSMPFSIPRFNPLHPGIKIGTEFPVYENHSNKTFFSINLRYIFHKNLYKAIVVSFEVGYDHKINYGGNLKAGAGIGYMHSFGVRDEYRFNDNGYKLNRDKGNSRFLSSISLGLGHRFNPNDFDSDEVFFLQEYWLEIPYSPGFIPIMSHSNSLLGAKLSTKKD